MKRFVSSLKLIIVFQIINAKLSLSQFSRSITLFREGDQLSPYLWLKELVISHL